jgi:hypothetical protein
VGQAIELIKPSAEKHKFPYHQEIRFFLIRFIGTINPLSPKRSCTNRRYEDFRSPALGAFAPTNLGAKAPTTS